MSQRVLPRFLSRLCQLDLRSVALFRVSLAFALMLALCGLWSAVPLWYADGGLLPRADAVTLGGLTANNLLLVSGATTLLRAIVVLGLLASLSLLLGYRSRLSLLMVGIVLFSFQLRTPAAATPADAVLTGLCLWALLLPLSGAWSIDRAVRDRTADSDITPGIAGVAWVLQWAWCALALLLALPESLAGGALVALGLAALLRGTLNTDAPAALTVPVLLSTGLLLGGIATRGGLGPEAWLLLAVVPLLPAALWALLRRSPGKAVQIYHDGHCALCRRLCRVLQEMLILPPGSTLSAAQDHARADTLLRAHDSWVVIDGQGHAHTHWAAVVALVRHSAWLWPLAPLIGITPSRLAGDRLYRTAAKARHRASRSEAPPAAGAPHNAVPGTGLRVTGVLLLVLQTLTVAGDPSPENRMLMGHTYSVLGMLPSRPAATEGQWLAAVEAEPGRFIDALRGNRALTPSLSAPAAPYDDARWQTYFAALSTGEQGATPRRLAQYLCQHQHPRPATVHLALLTAPTDGAVTERSRGARFDCAADGARPARAATGGDPFAFP
jgi:predicted DCC family thiol-disulfide oxidoreductase YuxK